MQEFSILNFINSKPKLVLVFVVLLASILRLYGIVEQSLWLDELSSMIGSAPWNSFEMIIEYCKKDQPPLFFISLQAWMNLFGYNELPARCFVAIIGILGVYAIFFLGKEIGNSNTGLIASFLAAINYFQLFFSQDVRFYSMVFLFSTLSFLFFLRTIKYEKTGDVLLYVLFTSSLFYTHYYSLVVYAVQITLTIWLVWRYKRSKKFLRLIFWGSALSIVLNIWWVPQYMFDVKTQDFWIGGVSPWFLFRYYWEYFKDPVACVVYFIAFCFYASWLLKHKWQLTLEPLILVGYIILCYLIPLIFSLLWEPMLLVRYTMIALPAVLVFIALGFQHIPNRKYKVYLCSLVLCSFLIFLFGFEKYYTAPHKTQWRELSKTVLNDSQKNYAFFSTYDFYFNSYFYQLTGSTSTRCYNPESIDFDKAISNASGIWLLEAHNSGSKITTQRLAAIQLKFKKDKEVKFYGAMGTLYVKR